MNNPLTQVGFLGGTIAPTTVAAALSAASYGGASAVTSSMKISFEEILINSIRLSSDFYHAQSYERYIKCYSSTINYWFAWNSFKVDNYFI
jgi:hypothetical protein